MSDMACLTSFYQNFCKYFFLFFKELEKQRTHKILTWQLRKDLALDWIFPAFETIQKNFTLYFFLKIFILYRSFPYNENNLATVSSSINLFSTNRVEFKFCWFNIFANCQFFFYLYYKLQSDVFCQRLPTRIRWKEK